MTGAAAAKSRRRTPNWWLAGVGLGLATFVAGLAWTAFGSARVVYTPAQAAEYTEAADALHAAHGSGGNAAQAQTRFDRAKQALAAARFAEHGLGEWIMAGGVAIALGFAVGYWSTRS